MSADHALAYPFPEAERTIPRMLEVQGGRLGHAGLFGCGGEQWSYAGAARIAAEAAGRLRAAGVAAGDRVAILSRNRPEVMRALLGAAWCGAVAVPVNAEARGPQVRHALANSGARVLAAEADLLGNLPTDTFAGLPLRQCLLIGAAGDAPPPALACEPFAQDAPPAPAHACRPEDPFAILYTSGTTGPSKGVVCPHAQFYWWAAYTCRFLEIRPGDVLATSLPLFHTNAINTFFQALLSGARQVVEPRFSVSGFWPAMRTSGATVSYLLGAMVPMLLTRAPSHDERSHNVRTILAPGVAPAAHAEFRRRTGIALVDGYGSTETNFVIGERAADRRDGRIGRLSPGIEARIVDGGGRDVEAGGSGELLLRTALPCAFASGYFANPQATAAAWREGWFHTGDLMRREPDGAFVFVDRLKDSIRRRGENVSSFEVEAALLGHPDVADAAVFAVPSELADEEVMASVVLRPGATATPQALAAHCMALLPRYAVPRFIDIRASLPLTENGKVMKADLKRQGVTKATWDRESAVPGKA